MAEIKNPLQADTAAGGGLSSTSPPPPPTARDRRFKLEVRVIVSAVDADEETANSSPEKNPQSVLSQKAPENNNKRRPGFVLFDRKDFVAAPVFETPQSSSCNCCCSNSTHDGEPPDELPNTNTTTTTNDIPLPNMRLALPSQPLVLSESELSSVAMLVAHPVVPCVTRSQRFLLCSDMCSDTTSSSSSSSLRNVLRVIVTPLALLNFILVVTSSLADMDERTSAIIFICAMCAMDVIVILQAFNIERDTFFALLTSIRWWIMWAAWTLTLCAYGVAVIPPVFGVTGFLCLYLPTLPIFVVQFGMFEAQLVPPGISLLRDVGITVGMFLVAVLVYLGEYTLSASVNERWKLSHDVGLGLEMSPASLLITGSTTAVAFLFQRVYMWRKFPEDQRLTTAVTSSARWVHIERRSADVVDGSFSRGRDGDAQKMDGAEDDERRFSSMEVPASASEVGGAATNGFFDSKFVATMGSEVITTTNGDD